MREHRWMLSDRCVSCGMRRDWPGARQACPLPTPAEKNAHKNGARDRYRHARRLASLTGAQKREITQRAKRGATPYEIAQRLGVTPPLVRAWLEEARVSAALEAAE